jgi:hypothetical protein
MARHESLKTPLKQIVLKICKCVLLQAGGNQVESQLRALEIPALSMYNIIDYRSMFGFVKVHFNKQGGFK